MFRTEGTEGLSKDCVVEHSATLPTSELLLLTEISFMELLQSGKVPRQFGVACMAFSVVSASPDKLSLPSTCSPCSPKLSCSLLAWYHSGFLSSDSCESRVGSVNYKKEQNKSEDIGGTVTKWLAKGALINSICVLHDVTWWRRCNRSDVQLWGGAVSTVGRVFYGVQL